MELLRFRIFVRLTIPNMNFSGNLMLSEEFDGNICSQIGVAQNGPPEEFPAGWAQNKPIWSLESCRRTHFTILSPIWQKILRIWSAPTYSVLILAYWNLCIPCFIVLFTIFINFGYCYYNIYCTLPYIIVSSYIFVLLKTKTPNYHVLLHLSKLGIMFLFTILTDYRIIFQQHKKFKYLWIR